MSDAKLDMLFEQIDHSLLKRISAEVKVDLKLAGVTLARAENPAPARMAKLRVVERFIDRHHRVGDIAEPGAEYVRDSMAMTWGWLRWRNDVDADGVPRRDMVLFQGRQGDYTVALAGSGRHVLAWNGIGEGTGYSLTSVTTDILWALDQHVRHEPELASLLGENKVRNPEMWQRREDPNAEAQRFQSRIIRALNADLFKGPAQRLEFMAVALVRHAASDDEFAEHSSVVLGTPLYIALAAEPSTTTFPAARNRMAPHG